MDILGKNLADLQQIIYFLLPGFLVVIFFFYQIPAKKRSDLELTIISIITSVFLSNLSIFLIWSLNYITNLKLKLPTNNNIIYVLSILFGLVISILLAKFVKSRYFFLINRYLGIKIFPFSRLWNDFFNIEENSVVKVFMVSGVIYVGVVRRSSVDPNDDIQELELWKPQYFDARSHTLTPVKETLSVLLSGTAISSIEMILKEEIQKIYPKDNKIKKGR